SRFRIGASISIPIMAAAAGAAIVWRNRTGRGQDLSIDLRKAIHGVNPVYKFKPTINGFPYQSPAFSPIVSAGFVFDLFLTRDGRWVLPTGGYPHMINEWCSLLHCTPDKASIANAILKWDGKDLDDLAAERNMVFALCRSKEEWALHPQGELLASKPLVEIEKSADSEPQPFGPADRPLSGVPVMSPPPFTPRTPRPQPWRGRGLRFFTSGAPKSSSTKSSPMTRASATAAHVGSI